MSKKHTIIEIVDSVITITSQDLISTIDIKEMETLVGEKEINSFLAKNFLRSLVDHPLSPILKRALVSIVTSDNLEKEIENEK